MKITEYGPGIKAGPVSIGIDPSLTAFAIAAVSEDGSEYHARLIKPSTRGPERLCELQDQVGDFIGKYGSITDIALEGTVRMSASASVLGELSGVVKSRVYRYLGTSTLNVPPMTLKVYANGPGKGSSKSQILLSCYKKWDIDLSDDNVADAYVLARIAGGLSTFDYERKALERLKDPKFRI